MAYSTYLKSGVCICKKNGNSNLRLKLIVSDLSKSSLFAKYFWKSLLRKTADV